MKPIIFNTEMVQAILDGRKTQTRRIIKNIPANTHRFDAEAGLEWSAHWGKSGEDYNGKAWFADYSKIVKPKYIADDVLWVRETWRSTDFEYHDGKWTASIQYKDLNKGPRVSWWDNTDVGEPDDCIYSKTGWRPSIHMPREAARLFLRVTDVRVERINQITNNDILREGVRSESCNICVHDGGSGCEHCFAILNPFRKLWDSINTKRGYGWDTNPWVWVYTFERIEKEDA